MNKKYLLMGVISGFVLILFAMSLFLIPNEKKRESLQTEIPLGNNASTYIGAKLEKVLMVNELTVKGQLFNRQQMINEFKQKVLNSKPFTQSFDVTVIDDLDKQNILIADFVSKCGQLTKENFVGKFPPDILTIFEILEFGCLK